MKITAFFVVAFLTVTVNAEDPETAVHLLASAQNDRANVVSATPAPTTFAPTPAPTNFSYPTLFPTAAPTGHAGFKPTTTSLNGEDATPSAKPAGIATEGVVGVAYATTRAEYDAETNARNDSGSTATVPIVIIGCLVGVLGVVAAAVVMKKRRAVVVEEGEGETNYSNSIRTPVVVKTKNSKSIHTLDVAQGEMDCLDDVSIYAV